MYELVYKNSMSVFFFYCSCINIFSHSNIALEGPGELSVLWNAMIYPLLNTTIKGAIWYQGRPSKGSLVIRFTCFLASQLNFMIYLTVYCKAGIVHIDNSSFAE